METYSTLTYDLWISFLRFCLLSAFICSYSPLCFCCFSSSCSATSAFSFSFVLNFFFLSTPWLPIFHFHTSQLALITSTAAFPVKYEDASKQCIIDILSLDRRFSFKRILHCVLHYSYVTDKYLHVLKCSIALLYLVFIFVFTFTSLPFYVFTFRLYPPVPCSMLLYRFGYVRWQTLQNVHYDITVLKTPSQFDFGPPRCFLLFSSTYLIIFFL